MTFHPRTFVAVAAVALVPAAASASPLPKKHHRATTARVHHEPVASAPRVCVDAPVEVVGHGESATFSLSRCDGTPLPEAIERFSALSGEEGAAPTASKPAPTPGHAHAAVVARPVKPAMDPGLLQRLAQVVDHFRSHGETARVVVVSGYRGAGSYHARGRALDFRIEGVDNAALASFCKTLDDTGCGYYPNDTFFHMDVRNAGTGHVAWTNNHRPTEAPHRAKSVAAAAVLPALPAHVRADDEGSRSGKGDCRRHSL